jgi:hypothetical protein
MSWPWKIALSLSWGLVLAGGLAYWAGATLLGLAWIYLYGDDPWPGHFDTVFLVVAVLAALLAFAAVAAAFVFLPRISPWLDRRLQVSAALRWAMLAMPLLVTAGVVGAYERGEAESARSFAADQALERRRAEAHRLISAEWRLDRTAGRLIIELAADGVAEGSYALLWEARGAGEPDPVGLGSSSHRLTPGPAKLILELDAAELARSYAEAVLTRPEAVQIDLTLTIELALAWEEDSATGQNSPLRLTVPISYHYRPDGSVQFSPAPS